MSSVYLNLAPVWNPINLDGLYRRDLLQGSDNSLSAWPLPGAEAKRGRARGRVTTQVKPIKTPSVKSTTTRASSTRRNPLLRRNSGQFSNNNAARNAPVVPAVAHGGATGGNSDSAKESMTVSASYNSYAGKKNKLAEVNRQESESANAKKTKKEIVIDEAQDSRVYLLFNQTDSVDNKTKIKKIESDSVDANCTTYQKKPFKETKVSLSCLDFVDTDNASHHLTQQILRKENNFFCINPRNEMLFKKIFTSKLKVIENNNIAALFSLPFQHNLPLNKNTYAFSRYREAGNMTITTADTRRGNDATRLYSVLTLSLLIPGSKIQESLPRSLILPANSFKALYFSDAAGHYHHFLAYHANQHSSRGGFNAGIYPISVKNGVFIMKHPSSGLEFSSSTLENLVSGLIRLTGFDYQSDFGNNRNAPNNATKIEATSTQNLFLDNNCTISESITNNTINPRLDLIQTFPINESNHDIALTKGSFTLLNETLCYVDFSGNKGEMALNVEIGDPGKVRIRISNQHEADLFNQLGISLATSYSREELVALMDAKGIAYLPSEESPFVSLPARDDDFYIDRIYHDEDQKLNYTSNISNGEEVIVGGHSKCFSLINGMLNYYDKSSRLHTIQFNATHVPDRYTLDESAVNHEPLFTKKFNIEIGHAYSREDLVKKLTTKNFVHFSKMLLSD